MESTCVPSPDLAPDLHGALEAVKDAAGGIVAVEERVGFDPCPEGATAMGVEPMPFIPPEACEPFHEVLNAASRLRGSIQAWECSVSDAGCPS